MYEESKKLIDEGMFNIVENLAEDHLNVFNNDELTALSNDNQETDDQKLNNPVLEDNDSNLNLLDHALSDEDVYKYLSFFNDNNFRLGDELDIETAMQPCSSINSNVSNATTVSTQETNEFAEVLLNSDLGKNFGDCLVNCYQTVDVNQNESTANIEQFTDKSLIVQNSNDTNDTLQMNSILNQTNITDAYSSTNQMIYNSTNSYNANEINQMNACQPITVNNQINQQQNDDFNSNQLIPINYYYPPISTNQVNQMNQFQYSNSPDIVQKQQTNFINNSTNLPFNDSNFLNASSLISASTLNFTDNQIIANNQNYINYLNSTECRDVNCPYTFCSSYNPYYDQSKDQFRQFNDNHLINKSVNMNAVDNQIVYNKPSNYVFDASTFSSNQPNQAAQTKAKRPRKTDKQIKTETVICNKSTDYNFFTLVEDKPQSKKKRGRKRKTPNCLEPN